MPALAANGQLVDPADLPTPADGPTWRTSTIDENGNVTTAERTGTPPPPGTDGSTVASSTGGLGDPTGEARAGLMKLIGRGDLRE